MRQQVNLGLSTAVPTRERRVPEWDAAEAVRGQTAAMRYIFRMAAKSTLKRRPEKKKVEEPSSAIDAAKLAERLKERPVLSESAAPRLLGAAKAPPAREITRAGPVRNTESPVGHLLATYRPLNNDTRTGRSARAGFPARAKFIDYSSASSRRRAWPEGLAGPPG